MTRLTKAQKAAILERDARNRALRTFLQGLALDVGVAIAFVVYDAVQSDQPDYRLLGLTVIKTALQTAASYVMRRFVDKSRVPTPLPPDPPGEPDNDAGHVDGAMLIGYTLAALLALILFHLLAGQTTAF